MFFTFFTLPQTQQLGRNQQRSYTYSEGSSGSSKTLTRSSSVNEDSPPPPDDPPPPPPPPAMTRKSLDALAARKSGDLSDLRCASSDVVNSCCEPKHYRQCSDSLVSSSTIVVDDPRRRSGGGNSCTAEESRDAITRLEPRGPLLAYHRIGTPYRSASFGQVDFEQGKRFFLLILKILSLTVAKKQNYL